MIDLIKKGLLAGIGATVTTKEKLDSTLNELVEKGKLSREEAEQTANKIVEESRKEYDDLRSELQGRVHEMLEKNDIVTREKFEALQKRVEELELKLATQEH